jgi:hypothetical protein
MDEHAFRRQVPRHQPPLTQTIHAGRGTLEDARGLGRLEWRSRYQVTQASVSAPLKCDEEATVPLANDPRPKQVRMSDRGASRHGDPQPPHGSAGGPTRFEGSHGPLLMPI